MNDDGITVRVALALPRELFWGVLALVAVAVMSRWHEFRARPLAIRIAVFVATIAVAGALWIRDV